MASNKSMGNRFEIEFCEILAEHGYWVHNMAQNAAGQPADVISSKYGQCYLIDCKVCKNDRFSLSRIEENQKLSMRLWCECGNGSGWFALKTSKGIYMLTHSFFDIFRKSSINLEEIQRYGTPLEAWMI